jgi:hypothetical protein
MSLAFNHIPHIKKKIVELIIVSLATNIVFIIRCKFVKLQNEPTHHVHAIQGLHIVLSKLVSTFVYLSTFVRRNYFLT